MSLDPKVLGFNSFYFDTNGFLGELRNTSLCSPTILVFISYGWYYIGVILRKLVFKVFVRIYCTFKMFLDTEEISLSQFAKFAYPTSLDTINSS